MYTCDECHAIQRSLIKVGVEDTLLFAKPAADLAHIIFSLKPY